MYDLIDSKLESSSSLLFLCISCTGLEHSSKVGLVGNVELFVVSDSVTTVAAFIIMDDAMDGAVLNSACTVVSSAEIIFRFLLFGAALLFCVILFFNRFVNTLQKRNDLLQMFAQCVTLHFVLSLDMLHIFAHCIFDVN